MSSHRMRTAIPRRWFRSTPTYVYRYQRQPARSTVFCAAIGASDTDCRPTIVAFGSADPAMHLWYDPYGHGAYSNVATPRSNTSLKRRLSMAQQAPLDFLGREYEEHSL